jgi:ribosomal protein L20
MRVKRGVASHQRHKKGHEANQRNATCYDEVQSNLRRQAVIRSLQYAYRDRRNKKRDFQKPMDNTYQCSCS